MVAALQCLPQRCGSALGGMQSAGGDQCLRRGREPGGTAAGLRRRLRPCGPGRAEDVSLKVSREISPRWSVAGGYRMVEGGADVDEVYNFAWLHFGVVSATWRF